MKKILITGIAGFAGSYLAETLLASQDAEIVGISLSNNHLHNLENILQKIRLKHLDLLDEKGVNELVAKEKPNAIFHLAALTSPALSFDNPKEVMTNNIEAEINLLEAVRRNNLEQTRILVVSSAHVYGKVDKKDLPIDEETPLRPTSAYAVSKIAQDFLGYQYHVSYNLPIVRVRAFNHIGPRQSPNFVVASFAKQIAEIEKGKKEPVLLVGDLTPKRDFTDVRDMVRAYVSALEKGRSGDVYNIGSDTSHSIEEVLHKLLANSTKKITVRQEESRMRPSDNSKLICNSEKFRKVTHWQPKIPIEQTLRDTLDYWRSFD